MPGSGGKEVFPVSNYEDSYLGTASLWSATATSDNSVFAELGLKVGTKRIARLARRMGIRTKLSTNPAMTLGGLKEGVTPLEMAYAYSTIANEGVPRPSSLAPGEIGPVGIQRGRGPRHRRRVNEPEAVERVFPAKVGRAREGDAAPAWSPAAPARPPRSATSTSGARPAPPRTTATPGSSAATTT